MSYHINGFQIGPKNPAFIIAELSCNHNQDYDLAVKTIHAIKEAGADAVKVQTYTPDTITLNADTKYFRIQHGTLWDGQTLYNLYQQAYTPWEWMPKLQRVAQKLGLVFFSSPFDESSVELLAKLNVPAYKVASFEIQDIPLIKKMAEQGKPMIISTGIASLADIELAIKTCHRVGNRQVALLKCTSAYPTPLNEVNLQTMVDMAKRFKVPVGVSDHTLGELVPVMAVTLGGSIIEKHFILDRKMGGPDAEFSMEPAEFAQMVKQVRSAEQALGRATYALGKKAKKNKEFGRSLFVIKDIAKGELLTKENIRSIRPGYGIHPKHYFSALGKRATRNLKRGYPLKLAHFAKK
jgi:pseudaminic acid synthase